MSSIRTVEVALADAAAISGFSIAEFRNMLLGGQLGPAPHSTSLATVPLLHIATAFLLRKLERAHLSPQGLQERIAGAALVELAEMELPQGRFQSRGGAGGGVGGQAFRNSSFEQRRCFYEKCLPEAAQDTKRFAAFGNGSVLLVDAEEDIEGDWEYVLDTRDAARWLKNKIRGELFIIEDVQSDMIHRSLRAQYLRPAHTL